jgi:hypothetical protein
MADDRIAQVEAAIARMPIGETQVESAIKAYRERMHALDRSFIVKGIVGLYVGVIAATIIYLIIQGLCHGDDRFTNIAELIKIAVVPVLTLVVGYYFGTERRQAVITDARQEDAVLASCAEYVGRRRFHGWKAVISIARLVAIGVDLL